MKTDVCDVCEKKITKRFGSFYTDYVYWEEHGYPQSNPSHGLELCENCRDKLLRSCNEIRRTNDLEEFVI